ncbi:MAG: hypothetical protein ACMVO3_00070 [Thalassobaculum sp.]
MRSAGWDNGEILEINQVEAYFAYANRTVLASGSAPRATSASPRRQRRTGTTADRPPSPPAGENLRHGGASVLSAGRW